MRFNHRQSNSYLLLRKPLAHSEFDFGFKPEFSFAICMGYVNMHA